MKIPVSSLLTNHDVRKTVIKFIILYVQIKCQEGIDKALLQKVTSEMGFGGKVRFSWVDVVVYQLATGPTNAIQTFFSFDRQYIHIVFSNIATEEQTGKKNRSLVILLLLIFCYIFSQG